MEFLYLLERLRNPIINVCMQLLTHLGEEAIFMAVALFFLWCVNKYKGYYLLIVGFVGAQLNQLLKVTFRIDRPWVRDPNFTVVQSAVPEATGYSFPSGHTQSAVGTFGGIARMADRRWLRIACVAVCILVPLSRMYLGVHTPADTLTSAAIALILIFALYPLLHRAQQQPGIMRTLLAAILLWSAGQLLFMESFPFPAEADGAELFSALENSYKMLGAVAGFCAAYWLDQSYIHYETAGCWWVQLLKWSIGLLLTVALKEFSYWALRFLPGALIEKAVAYFIVVLFAGAVWPLTFRYFKKLEAKK